MVLRDTMKSVPTGEHKRAQVTFDFIPPLFYKELICHNIWYQVSLRLHQFISVRPLQKTDKCYLFL